MSHDNMQAIDTALRDLSLDDRIAALVLNIIERREGVEAMSSLVAVIGAMSKSQLLTQRFAIAEMLRDTADVIDRLQSQPVERV